MLNMDLHMLPHGMPGKLITFCGLDGCGKSTMIKMLSDQLSREGYEVFLTKQPTDAMRKTEIFRTYMDTNDHSEFRYRTLSMMAAADRIQHVNKVILPALKKGQIVICDRYFYSCLANLLARGFGNDKWIYEIAEKEIIEPDLAFFLEVPIEVAVSRIRARPEEKDRYIDMNLQVLLHNEYTNIALNNNGILLSSNEKPERTYQKIKKIVKEKLK